MEKHQTETLKDLVIENHVLQEKLRQQSFKIKDLKTEIIALKEDCARWTKREKLLLEYVNRLESRLDNPNK